MNNEFVPYEEALAMKELGFNGIDCLKDFDIRNKTSLYDSGITTYNNPEDRVPAPLYQQAFKWFREKGYHNGIVPIFDYHYYIIKDFNKDKEYDSEYEDVSYEEAQLACLRKLIEIVNQNKDENS